jgi:glucose-6-phosphate 1-dehydrogenase
MEFVPPPASTWLTCTELAAVTNALTTSIGKCAAPWSSSQESADLTEHETLMSMPLTVVIFGATGDLAKKKLFPALYQLCLHKHLPRSLDIVGYGRSDVNLPEFINKQCAGIKEDPQYAKHLFTSRIRFHAGGYDEDESYARLAASICEYEATQPAANGIGNRLYFLSVPPSVFGAVVDAVSKHGRAPAGGFTRLMIEKPFGRDSGTFAELNQLTSSCFRESQLFRLDHYLGKEVILNIPTLRWANQIFEPVWSRQYIESVQLTFKEDLGTAGRGGYFDSVGIIRDIIQNHLLQAFMWLAMEPPTAMSAAEIVKAKVSLLRSVSTLYLGDGDGGGGFGSVFLGQYSRHGDEPGYLDDKTVPAGSTCPTFAACVLEVNTARWRGVPFLFTAGKGMDERVCELRVRFKPQPHNAMMGIVGHQNELVMRIQPDEALYIISVAKEPGITAEQVRKPVVMDMSYAQQFTGAYLGDAYERMFLNCARGDQSLFVSEAELFEAWRIFTPLLHEIDERRPQPVRHPFGLYPRGYHEWVAARGVTIRETWNEFIALHGDRVDEMRQVFNELDKDKSGTLDFSELTALAKRFYDGREPTLKRIRAIFDELGTGGEHREHRFDASEDAGRRGQITFEQMLASAQRMQRAFEVELDDHRPYNLENQKSDRVMK